MGLTINATHRGRMKPKFTFRGVILKADPSRLRMRPKPATPRGGATAVRVGHEVAGRAGTGVSATHGLPIGTVDLKVLAGQLHRLCAAGDAVKEIVNEDHGDHRDRLVLELRKLGYDAKRAGG